MFLFIWINLIISCIIHMEYIYIIFCHILPRITGGWNSHWERVLERLSWGHEDLFKSNLWSPSLASRIYNTKDEGLYTWDSSILIWIVSLSGWPNDVSSDLSHFMGSSHSFSWMQLSLPHLWSHCLPTWDSSILIWIVSLSGWPDDVSSDILCSWMQLSLPHLWSQCLPQLWNNIKDDF